MTEYFAILEDRPEGKACIVGTGNTIRNMTVEETKQDPGWQGKVIEQISQQDAEFLSDLGNLYHDRRSIPCWQLNASQPLESRRGSWSDPQNTNSTWQTGVALADARPTLVCKHASPSVSRVRTASRSHPPPTTNDPETNNILLYEGDHTEGLTNEITLLLESSAPWNGVRQIEAETPLVVNFSNGSGTMGVVTNTPRGLAFRSTSEYKFTLDVTVASNKA